MKKKNLIYILTASFVLSSVAMASDSVSAATSDDLSAFDSALAQHRKADASAGKKPKTANFGAVVSSKAQEIKGSGAPDDEKNFGQWVSKQRRNNESHAQAGGAGKGAGSGQGAGGGVAGGNTNAGSNGNGGGNSNGNGGGNGHGHGH